MLSERKERLPSKSLRLAQFVQKRGMFIVSQALPVNNPQQILVRVTVITPRGSVRGNVGVVGLATNPMGIHLCKKVLS